MFNYRVRVHKTHEKPRSFPDLIPRYPSTVATSFARTPPSSPSRALLTRATVTVSPASKVGHVKLRGGVTWESEKRMTDWRRGALSKWMEIANLLTFDSDVGFRWTTHLSHCLINGGDPRHVFDFVVRQVPFCRQANLDQINELAYRHLTS